jgi:hypothetical protein
MAAPNQGLAPNPNPGNNNPDPTLPTRDIDLSDPVFHSDGQSQKPQVADLTSALRYLTQRFSSNPHYVTTLGKSHSVDARNFHIFHQY